MGLTLDNVSEKEGKKNGWSLSGRATPLKQ